MAKKRATRPKATLPAKALSSQVVGRHRPATAMTVLVHGTFAPAGQVFPWYLPSTMPRIKTTLFDYLRDKVYTGTGEEVVTFHWTGMNTALARKRAARDLVEFCNCYPTVQTWRFIGHSHGANVVNMATNPSFYNKQHPGLRAHRLVLLSPAVVKNVQFYQPHPSNVGDDSDHAFFNFHVYNDEVLKLFKLDQTYVGTPVEAYERPMPAEKQIVARNNHWAPTEVDVWRAHNIAKAIQ